jgi:hypothetical protein
MQIELPDAKKILASNHITLDKNMTEERLSTLIEALVNTDVAQSEKQLAIYIIIAEIE